MAVHEKDLVSQEEFENLLEELNGLAENLSDEQKKKRQAWLDMKYIPDGYFDKKTVEEINDEMNGEFIDEDIRKFMSKMQECYRANNNMLEALFGKSVSRGE